MTLEAVAEKPAAAAPDATHENPPSPETGLVAGQETDPLQPASTPETPATPEAPPAEDEGVRLAREAHEAELEVIREQTRADERKKIADSTKETTRQQAAQTRARELDAVKAGFSPAMERSRAALAELGIYDRDEQNKVLGHLDGYNGQLGQLHARNFDAATAELRDSLGAWLIESAPEGAARAEIQKLVDEDAGAEAVLPMVIEARALTSDAVTKAKPEALIEANKALKAYVAAERLAAHNDGRKKPYPDVESHIDGSPVAGRDPTYQELTRMTEAQIHALPAGTQARVIAKAVSEG